MRKAPQGGLRLYLKAEITIKSGMIKMSVAPKLLLAPLKGLTDEVFRKTYAEHFSGLDGMVAPFVTAVPADRLTEHHVRDLLPRADGASRCTQILGNAAENFVFLARHLYDKGYEEVNWNLGCPFRPVPRNARRGPAPFRARGRIPGQDRSRLARSAFRQDAPGQEQAR
jgi:hypothetical protein